MPAPERYLNRLVGKVAIVTGAGGVPDGDGTGKAIAILFAGEGAKVCVADALAERAELTRSLIAAEGGEAFCVTGNVARDEDCHTIVSQTVERFGRLDVLVNNVGISGGTTFEQFDEADWQRTIDVNLKSAVLMSRHAVPVMAAQGGGTIINIASIAGIRRYGSLAYGPSKAAMIALSGDIAMTQGKHGIRANTIAPGHVMTPMAVNSTPPEAREARRKAGPLGLEGDAWDVAFAAVFLASDEARFVNGVCLPVDGGVIEAGSLFAHHIITQ